jgi:hypothetical protein
MHAVRLQALQSDSEVLHIRHGGKKPTMAARAWIYAGKTIFARRYLGVAIDEAHGFRNPNKLYAAIRALRDETDILVAMTATPVQTRPAVRG